VNRIEGLKLSSFSQIKRHDSTEKTIEVGRQGGGKDSKVKTKNKPGVVATLLAMLLALLIVTLLATLLHLGSHLRKA